MTCWFSIPCWNFNTTRINDFKLIYNKYRLKHKTSYTIFTFFIISFCSIDIILCYISFILNKISCHTRMFIFDMISGCISRIDFFSTISTSKIIKRKSLWLNFIYTCDFLHRLSFIFNATSNAYLNLMWIIEINFFLSSLYGQLNEEMEPDISICFYETKMRIINRQSIECHLSIKKCFNRRNKKDQSNSLVWLLICVDIYMIFHAWSMICCIRT